MISFDKAVGVALAAMLLTGCSAIGLEPLEELRAHEEAKYRAPKPLVEATVRVAPEPPAGLQGLVVELDGREWVPTATEYRIQPGMVRPVATAGGVQLSAFAWDQPPYDRLLAATPHGFYVELSEAY